MQKLVILGGPTGSGKNKIALAIANRFPAEIVNADSRQIYRGLVIGTNQPTAVELESAPHHLYGFLEPDINFSVADYERTAMAVISGIRSRGRIPVIVGGTGFYIRALLKGTWPVPKHDPELRLRMRKIMGKRGKDHLYALLQRIDPVSATQISSNDSYRVMRALEIYFQSGRRRSEFKTETNDRIPAVKFFIDPAPGELQRQIEQRTRLMFEAGWVDEVRTLLERYPDFRDLPASRALGYPEILAYLSSKITLEESIAKVVQKTLQYAKRQRTWFRNQDQFERVSTVEELHKKLEFVLQ